MPDMYENRDSFLAPARHAYDVTPSASVLPHNTRAVMVSIDGATITGVLEGDGSTPHTTFPLTAGVMYALAFKIISVVSSGSVKAYW